MTDRAGSSCAGYLKEGESSVLTGAADKGSRIDELDVMTERWALPGATKTRGLGPEPDPQGPEEWCPALKWDAASGMVE